MVLNYCEKNKLTIVFEVETMPQEIKRVLNFLCMMKGKKVVIFGTGKGSAIISECFPVFISYYIDNDPMKWGTEFLSRPINNPQIILNEDVKPLFILVLSSYYSSIKSQLEFMGFKEGIHFYNGFEIFSSLLASELEVTNFTDDNVKPLIKKHVGVKFIGDSNADDESVFEGYNVMFPGANLNKTQVGKHTYIGERTRINLATIGRFCSIAPECIIGLENHPSRGFLSTFPGFYLNRLPGDVKSFVDENLYQDVYLPVIIGNDVWIGTRAIIRVGVRIGDGAIIGSGAVVTQNIEPYTIVGGVPAKTIRKRYSDEQINKLLAFRWWEKSDEWLCEHASMFAHETNFFQTYF